MSFCKGCGAGIEWQKTADDRNIPIDPDPHPDGNLTFDERVRVVVAPKGSKPVMYRSHFATCPKANQFRKTPRVGCDKWEGCDRTDRHSHCRRCGGTDHWVADCEEDPS